MCYNCRMNQVKLTADEIIYKKVGEWEQKGSRLQLKNRIELWLNQFEKEERKEMLRLLYHFDYYSSHKIPQIVKSLYLKFREICDSEDVVFAKVEKQFGTSFSSIFFMSFWFQNNLYDYTEENLSNIICEEDLTENLVIVDDYFGSGESFIKYINKLVTLNPNIKLKNIYFIAHQGSYIGKKAIDDYAAKNKVNITIIVNKYSKKAFEYGNIYSESLADKHRQLYSEIYDKRNQNPFFKFGYGEVEALVSFYYNTPNNTLGLFWQNMCGFKALFSRHDKKRTTLNSMKIKSRQNKELQAEKPFIRDVENYKLDLFMVYCVSKQNDFDIYEACTDFGLTEQQLNEMLTYLLNKQYLKNENGKYSATDQLKKYLYTSRLKSFKHLYEKEPEKNKIVYHDVSYIPKTFKDKFSGYKN